MILTTLCRNGNNIVYQSDGTNTFYYFYDGDKITSFEYNGNLYYYVRNLQDDVVAIVDGINKVIAQYSYDAYGKIISITDSIGADLSGNATHIANLNPIRYRGYYYDKELQMYYLQSRYYDPTVGRFISADDASILLATEGQVFGANLFAYCFNNPVMNVDPSGYEKVSLKQDFFYLDKTFYGGAQSWWVDLTFSFVKRKKKDVGCATVAAANVMAYLAARNKKLSNLYPYKYTKKDFSKMMNTMWNYVTPGIAGFWWLGDFVRGVEKYSKNKKAKLKGCWSNKSANLNNAIQYVKDGLRRDCPVTLVIHLNRTLKDFQNHWMVITSIDDRRDKKGNGPVTIKISSWGKSYQLDFRKVIKNSSYCGLIYFTW